MLAIVQRAPYRLDNHAEMVHNFGPVGCDAWQRSWRRRASRRRFLPAQQCARLLQEARSTSKAPEVWMARLWCNLNCSEPRSSETVVQQNFLHNKPLLCC